MSSPSDSSTVRALSPLDGRYRDALAPLAAIFSEQSLVLRRIQVELRWLLQLAEAADPAFADLAAQRQPLGVFLAEIEGLISNSNNGLQDIEKIYSQIKKIEKTSRHDVKAVEYWLQEQLTLRGLQDCVPMLHFGCTSEDINSTAWGLMFNHALDEVLCPQLGQLADRLGQMAADYADAPMLARTHGQSATPTTMGKEIAVYYSRLGGQLDTLRQFKPRAKFSGATGNYSAWTVTLPSLDWPLICRQLIESLGLEYSRCTTQVESGDRLAEICHCLMRINRILTDLARDFWGYISLGYLAQRKAQGEIGSSTMPHKTNPIDFENAEGNMAMAHAVLEKLASDLPVSRWQRDLSGSTLQRNLGTGLGHCLLAWQAIGRGLERVSLDEAVLKEDLQQHWEVLAEAVQTALRLSGDPTAYDKLHALSRQDGMDTDSFASAVRELPLSDELRNRLAQLSPAAYIGLAAQLAREPTN